MRARALFLLGAVLAAGIEPASAQARRGAVIGGVAGALAVGMLGALLGQAMCDAADCSGEWVDGAVPGSVFGGFGGAAVGAAIGALIDGRDRPAPPRDPTALVLEVSGAVARAESNLVEQGVTGGGVLAGVRFGSFLIGPAAQRTTGGGWRVTSVGLATRVDPARGTIRPFAEVEVARFGWSHPAILARCTAPGVCTYQPGTLSDRYLGVAGGVGASVGRGPWRGFAALRYHHAGGRPAGEPGSTQGRSVRQLEIGGAANFALR